MIITNVDLLQSLQFSLLLRRLISNVCSSTDILKDRKGHILKPLKLNANPTYETPTTQKDFTFEEESKEENDKNGKTRTCRKLVLVFLVYDSWLQCMNDYVISWIFFSLIRYNIQISLTSIKSLVMILLTLLYPCSWLLTQNIGMIKNLS